MVMIIVINLVSPSSLPSSCGDMVPDNVQVYIVLL